MSEIGIDIRHQRSKVVDPAMIESAKLVVTVCDHAKEHCPVVPAHVRQLHWSFDDPANARGTDEEITSVFRRVRDEIGEHVRGLIGDLQEQNIGKES
jgi:arsenate reductase